MPAPDAPFAASSAIAAGGLTRGELRSRCRRVFPGVWIHRAVSLDPVTAARAAWCWSRGHGVLAGWSAAAMLGLRWIPADADAEVVLPQQVRQPPGLQVWHWRLHPADVEVDEDTGIPLTTPLRTAYDLGRRLPLVDAVATVDALCRLGVRPPADVLEVASRNPHGRGLVRLREVVRLSDPGSDSPWETRLRVLLVRAGLPKPDLQVPVGDPARPWAVLDLGWPQWRVAVEFDGRHHASGAQFGRDLRRHNTLLRHGWVVLRFDAAAVAGDPDRVLHEVRDALRRAGAPV